MKCSVEFRDVLIDVLTPICSHHSSRTSCSRSQRRWLYSFRVSPPTWKSATQHHHPLSRSCRRLSTATSQYHNMIRYHILCSSANKTNVSLIAERIRSASVWQPALYCVGQFSFETWSKSLRTGSYRRFTAQGIKQYLMKSPDHQQSESLHRRCCMCGIYGDTTRSAWDGKASQ